MRAAKLFSFVCSLALFIPALCNQLPTGTFTGVITDPNGAIIPGAFIRVQDWDSDQTSHPKLRCDGEFQANSSGRFTIELRPGDYDVFIAYPGISPFAKKVEIKKGKVTKLNRKLSVDRLTKFIEEMAHASRWSFRFPRQVIEKSPARKYAPAAHASVTVSPK
jgi:Carboxypeptidase regulatory-like domain